MTARSDWKLVSKIMDKLTPEQVSKVLSIFTVNKGVLKMGASHEVMVDNNGSITSLNRIGEVGLRDFYFSEAKTVIVEKVEVVKKPEIATDDFTIVLDDEKK